jgi:hypothetical protein
MDQCNSNERRGERGLNWRYGNLRSKSRDEEEGRYPYVAKMRMLFLYN